MNKSETLNLSIGDDVADSRLSNDAYSGRVELQGKSVRIKVSKTARHAISAHHTPILAQLELYFSYLVQKQVHFREVADTDLAASAYARVLPGLYAAFRAVTTKEYRIADIDGKPPVETMPVKKPAQFVPDWIRIDYRAGRWRGEYGFARNL